MDFIRLEDIEGYSIKQLNRLYKKYYENGFYKLLKLANLNLNFKEAKGLKLYDYEGNEYLDFISSFGCMSLGHNNKEILEAIIKYSDYPNIVQQGINIFNGVLANNLAYLTDYELTRCHLTNCGTEAVEEALKLALMYNDDGHIIYFNRAYHGKTIGSLSILGSKLKDNYNIDAEFFHEAEYGDIEQVERLCKEYKISAIITEPIQGEGGIIIPKKSFMKQLRNLCDDRDILLIFDEIQTGIGRCGEIFGYKLFDVIPDIMCLSKTLSGGYIPIGAIMVQEEIWEKTYGKTMNGEMLGTTFSGNTLGCIAAIKTLTIIREKNLVKRVSIMGNYAIKQLLKVKENHNIITDVRGEGLLIGIEFGGLSKLCNENIIMSFMSTIVSKLLNEYKILVTLTGNNKQVLRFEPAFIVNEKEIDYFAYALDQVLNDGDNILKLALDTGKLVMNNVMKS